MQTFNLPSQVCRQTFNLPRKFECKLAPPFACKCLRACPRVQICLQTFKTPPRKFSRKLSTPASQKNCRGHFKIAILPHVFGDRSSFRAKSWRGTLRSHNFASVSSVSSVFCDRTSFRKKGLCRGGCKIAILQQFLAIEPHFVRNGCVVDTSKSQFYITVFGDRTSFRAKGLPPRL